MKQLFSLIILFLTIGSSAQLNDKIKLPNTNQNLDSIETNNFYSIYITENEEVFFENERLRFWDQISNKLLSMKREPILKASSDIVIYADHRISYYVIQKVREEIGRVWSGMIHYKAHNFDNSSVLSFFVAGSFFGNHEIGMDWTFDSYMIYTKEEKNQEKEVPDLEANTWPVSAPWQNNFSKDFKNFDSLNIKNTLKRLTYNKIRINSNDQVNYNNINQDISELNKDIDKLDLLFVTNNPNLTYGEFFVSLSILQNMRQYDDGGSPFTMALKKPFLIEIPYYFEEKVKKLELNIID